MSGTRGSKLYRVSTVYFLPHVKCSIDGVLIACACFYVLLIVVVLKIIPPNLAVDKVEASLSGNYKVVFLYSRKNIYESWIR